MLFKYFHQRDYKDDSHTRFHSLKCLQVDYLQRRHQDKVVQSNCIALPLHYRTCSRITPFNMAIRPLANRREYGTNTTLKLKGQ